MYDAEKIIPGLVIFLCLITSPIWYNALVGGFAQKAEPKIATPEEKCMESKEYMRDKHMKLLEEWRLEVVREGTRAYVSTRGEVYDKSVEECRKCHPNKAEFCDECHDYAGVTPICWSCHYYPGG